MTAVAYTVDEVALELTVCERVETNVCCYSSAKKVVFVELEGKNIVALTSKGLA